MLPVPLFAVLSRVTVPWAAGFLPTVKNQVDKNESEAVAGVGLGEGAGLGDGAGVGVGVGPILLETEPQPASKSKNPVQRVKVTVRKKTSCNVAISQRRGTYLISKRAAAERRLSWKEALTLRAQQWQRK
jgi:hypothetical protein